MRKRSQKTYLDLETFDKTQLVDYEMIDKVTLWMLRAILKCGGHKEFLDKNNYFHSDDIAYFLDIGKYVEMDSDDFKRADVLNTLKSNLAKLEKRKRFASSKILTKNIKQLSKLMKLNSYEEQILEFNIIQKQYQILSDTTDLIGNDLNTNQAKKTMSTILNIPIAEVSNAFATTSKFSKSLMLTIEKKNTYDLNGKIEFLSDAFVDNMMNLDEDISVMIEDSVKECGKATLSLKDFEHKKEDIEILSSYLEDAISSKKKGVNILLYGLPGTGKTELVKTLAKTLHVKLFEVSYANLEDEAIDGKERLKAYKTAQALLANQDTLLMYDEAEDIFESSGGGLFSPPKRQSDKAWINRVLETNTIPTIWITNNIYSIDNAIVRRFDMSIEMPIPSKSKRVEIIKKSSGGILDIKSIELLATNENIAPALVSSASKVVSSIKTSDKTKAFTQIINNTLKAQGHKEIESKPLALPGNYNAELINTTMDLDELTIGIKESQNARLCLYGPAGTGKSAFGKYIAQSLDKPLHIKKGSDLLGFYVGQTEKNIANAFAEAKEEKAVLIFDEVDSFLADRSSASKSWEITQVNEMLVQMENFDGIFIATTNLMDNLDRASLRRFDLKLQFDYLKSEQAWKMFISFAKELKLSTPSLSFKKGVENLKYLTPGDFAAVVRQHRFRPIRDIKDMITRLKSEVEVKMISGGNKMGFLN